MPDGNQLYIVITKWYEYKNQYSSKMQETDYWHTIRNKKVLVTKVLYDNKIKVFNIEFMDYIYNIQLLAYSY